MTFVSIYSCCISFDVVKRESESVRIKRKSRLDSALRVERVLE